MSLKHKWQKLIGSLKQDLVTNTSATAINSKGHIYIAGIWNRDTLSDSLEFIITKLDKNTNNILWQKNITNHIGENTFSLKNSLTGIAIDSNDNIYIAGVTEGEITGVATSGKDIFIIKYNVNGVYKWIKIFPESVCCEEEDLSLAIIADMNNNIYITGDTLHDIDGVGGTETQVGLADTFLIKINANGIEQWTRQLGPTIKADTGISIATDLNSNIYIVGTTYGSSSPSQTDRGSIFVMKIDSSGNVVWEEILPYSEPNNVITEGSTDIVIDSQNNIFVTGYIQYFVAIDNSITIVSFITKLDKNTHTEIWTREIGLITIYDAPQSTSAFSNSITVDSKDNIYVTGSTDGVISGSNQGVDDTFVIKFNNDGKEIWKTQFGTSGYDSGRDIIVDDKDNIYITGNTMNDIFITRYDLVISKILPKGLKYCKRKKC